MCTQHSTTISNFCNLTIITLLIIPYHSSAGLDLLKKFVTSRTVIFALIAGCGLQMFQQLGGINTVM